MFIELAGSEHCFLSENDCQQNEKLFIINSLLQLQ